MSTREPWICPTCRANLAPHVDACPFCLAATPLIPQPSPILPIPWLPPMPWAPLPTAPTLPGTITITYPQPQRCMFDGLPPGTYGIACQCPKCNPNFACTVNPLEGIGTVIYAGTSTTTTS